jgi:methionyl-tRNA formyltransferase
MNIIIATIKSWNINNAEIIKEKYNKKHKIYIVRSKNELTMEFIKDINPEYIFFPHWSWLIPKNIYNSYNCIVFHMTDLPYGRGGSPLQNLIVRGHKNTKISALKVDGGIDTGDIFLKKDLDLTGSAEEIYKRASQIVFNDMIPKIIELKIEPKSQVGECYEFKRRKPEESKIEEHFDINKIFDFIRMLDAEGYPNACIEYGANKLLFKNAKKINKKIYAEVVIMENDDNE